MNTEFLRNDETYTSFVTPEKQKEILHRMQDLLKKSGMTIQQLSDVTYISESTITRYFAGKTKDPHFFTMVTLIIAMGGDVNEILGITPAKPDEAPAENPYGVLLEAYRTGMNSLADAVDTQTAAMLKMQSRFDKRQKWNTVIYAIFAVILVSFTALELVDLFSPEWGRYQCLAQTFRDFFGG